VPVGSGLISGPRADEGSDMKKGHVNIIFLSYNWHKKTFPEIDELQCDAVIEYFKSVYTTKNIDLG
jgi:hypothetical protein